MTVISNPISIHRYMGLSTDTKPTIAAPLGFAPPTNASTFYEYDTGALYVTHNGTDWMPKDIGSRRAWTFGEPTLMAQGNATAKWKRGTSVLSTHQKGSTGWVAELLGGIQSSHDDAAAVYIPVNELPIPDFNSALWTYFFKTAEAHGCNIGFFVHDPTDNDKRGEISQSGAAVDLEKDAGWNAHELNPATAAQFFYYAENLSAGDSDLESSNTKLYSWAEFQADKLFSTWTIFRISLNHGYYTGDGYFDACYVADIKFNGQVIPLKPSVEEQLDLVRDDQAKALTTIPTWTFGAPVLRVGGVGKAGWLRSEGSVEGLLQKSPSGIIANLYGGDQTAGTGDVNWAAVYVPVNEMPTPDFNSAQWTYRFAGAEEHGHNMVIWLHDPADFGNRVEVTQAPSHAGLARADGWNDHKLNTATAQFFYYGEGVSGSGLVAGTQYTWQEFQADVVFSTWKIYRISIEYGWYSAGVFGETWLTDLMLNGQVILLQPGPGEIMGREVKSSTSATPADSTVASVLVTPGSGRRIKVLSLNMITVSAIASNFECYFSVSGSMPAAKVIAVRNLGTGAVAEHFVNFGDNGPEGLVDEPVSMRTSVDIATNGTYTIVYREI